jgi:TonB family protein
MEKNLKYCGSCEESFIEKFGFCPNCGAVLQEFEMRPVEAAAAAAPVSFRQPPLEIQASLEEQHRRFAREGGFYVTVIEEKNVAQRNGLMLGTLCLMMLALMTGLVYNIFSKDLDMGSINDDLFNAVIVDQLPMDDDAPPPKKKDDGRGGGGGGDNDPNPASKGDRAPMRTDPQLPPSVSMDRLTNPAIPVQMAIKGPINEFRNADRYGVKFGPDTPSDGPGSNGGQGPGRNGGQGPGIGPGYGPGSNGGLPGGDKGGISSDDGPNVPPPVITRGITQGVKILAKPRPSYTDAARQAYVQGSVILRVTFLASGQIGGVSAVTGLPNGLTEQAIAAAHRIVFEPAKLNGVPQSVTKQIEYTFSIY